VLKKAAVDSSFVSSCAIEKRPYPAPFSENRYSVTKRCKIKAKIFGQNGFCFYEARIGGRGKIAGKKSF
jgi:hypothetical protein